jgi:hypothetical protein
LPLGSIESITILPGGGANQKVIIDASNGPINIPDDPSTAAFADGLTIDGAGGSTVIQYRAAVTGPLVPKDKGVIKQSGTNGSYLLTVPDAFGQIRTQAVGQCVRNARDARGSASCIGA